MDLRLSHWISHKYLLLTLSLIDSSWNCSIQIISKLSSVVSRSSVSVYQVSLWLIACTENFFQSKLDSVMIFLSKDSCVCKILSFVTLPAIDVFFFSRESVGVSHCAFGLLCFIRCFLVKLYILFNRLISTVLPPWW